jgi:hypothetical protein
MSGPRDLSAVRGRYLALRRALAVLAAGAAVAAAAFALLSRRPEPWLAPTAAEGLVFAGAVLGMAVVMLGLNGWYLGRPSRGAVPPAPGPRWRPGPGAAAVVAGLAAATAALVWSEHRFAVSLAAGRDRASTLDRALLGQVQAPMAGVAGTLTIIAATFVLAAALRRAAP